MRAILVVLSALTATAVVHTRDCRACIFVTAVVKKVMTQGREITNENVVGLTCPRLLRDNPPSVGKLCKNIVKEILDSRILMRKIKACFSKTNRKSISGSF
ncbi:hypothetical protein ANCCAN_09202 [Ancylostoma caninum]|uniref:Saposin B-type domain-containing protein n=1 Tax=Ancylostoma caninum TaxID=29170 RepID=A0A368GK59_ANCCA|nr:hypothetical protein ANCCAN_09202 [Ancylostoma caninum]